MFIIQKLLYLLKKSYTQRDNKWTPMKLVTESYVVNKPVSAGSFSEAVNIFRIEAEENGQMSDTWYVSEIESIVIY